MTGIQAVPAKPSRRYPVDLADILLVSGLALVIAGIAHFSGAIAEIVTGLFCFLFVLLIHRGRRPAQSKAEKGS